MSERKQSSLGQAITGSESHPYVLLDRMQTESLTDIERGFIERHIQKCPACATYVAVAEIVSDKLTHTAAPAASEPPYVAPDPTGTDWARLVKEFWLRVQFPVPAYVAALSLVVGVALAALSTPDANVDTSFRAIGTKFDTSAILKQEIGFVVPRSDGATDFRLRDQDGGVLRLLPTPFTLLSPEATTTVLLPRATATSSLPTTPTTKIRLTVPAALIVPGQYQLEAIDAMGDVVARYPLTISLD